jgi:hypothetical protein
MMPVTITFHKVSEKKPEHQQSIIWLKTTYSFGYQGFEPREIQADYVWENVDEDGRINGCAACFDPETEDVNDPEQIINGERWKLFLLFDGWCAHENDLWVDVDEYWKCFEEEE